MTPPRARPEPIATKQSGRFHIIVALLLGRHDLADSSKRLVI
jgi:hypothetical protein